MQSISENEKVEYAGFWVRAFAYFVDLLIIGFPMLFLRLIFWLINLGFEESFLAKPLLFQYDLTDIIIYLLQSVYFIACTYLTGTTLGKRLLNLKVVAKDEEKPELLTIIYRETVGRFLSGIVLNLGYLLIGLDKEKRGFHDYLCDTRVIYAKKVKIFEEKKIVTIPQMARPQEMNQTVPQEQKIWQVPQGE